MRQFVRNKLTWTVLDTNVTGYVGLSERGHKEEDTRKMAGKTLKLLLSLFRFAWIIYLFYSTFCWNMESDQSPKPEQPPKPINEPIRFGIDRILGSSDRLQVAEKNTDSPTETTSPFAGLSGPILAAFPGFLEDPSGLVPNRTVGHRGVIRVPAHRPLGAAIAPPVVSAAPGFGPLCFPWVENHRRFTKDRLPGNCH